MKTDLEIVQIILNGDKDAYREVLSRYEKSVFRYVISNTKDEEMAKDICQEVFIQAYYKLYSYKKKYDFAAWLFKIAHNKTIDFIRKNKRQRIVNLDETIKIDNVKIYSNDLSPENAYEYRELKGTIENFIGGLSKAEQQIIMFRYSCEELSFKNIGEILNINENTVKYKYYRIYEKYEKYIESSKGVERINEM